MTGRERWLLLALFILLAWVIMRKILVDEDVVKKIARGFAFAEGFFKSGSRPKRNHNPGDLTLDTTGKAIGKDDAYVIYANDSDGWEALFQQVRLMLKNTSSHYNRSMTITEVSRKYTSTEQADWARNVATFLGVTVDTKLEEIQA